MQTVIVHSGKQPGQTITIALLGLLLILSFSACSPEASESVYVELDGNWSFAYIDTFVADRPELPAEQAFLAKMPVPAVWDDELARLQASPLKNKLTYSRGAAPVDFSTIDHERQGYRTKPLPYVEGVGFYKTSFDLAALDADHLVVLEVQEVSQEAWVWVNDSFVGHHLGHALTFDFNISDLVTSEHPNTLVIAVSNLTDYAGGFAMSGYKGRRGGLTGSVRLKLTENAQIRDLFVHSNKMLDTLFWESEIMIRKPIQGRLIWKIKASAGGLAIASDTLFETEPHMKWSTTNPGLKTWSDLQPQLYQLEISLWDADTLLDVQTQPFGLRNLQSDGLDLKLNHRSIYLRGVTDHCYWAETLMPPKAKDDYKRIIGRLQAVGFNWIRFHTWLPNQAYLDAADEMGMLMMLEAPPGFDLNQWNQVFRQSRRHPSVVLYSGGNEQHLDEEKIEFLALLARQQKKWVPDGLFNPQEALRGVEYWWRLSDLGADTTHSPFIHNPRRLERLQEFSDVFGQYGWGYLSYWSEWGDAKLLDTRLPVYERPCLAHEVGIKGNYIDLKLGERMRGTIIGSQRYDSARNNLRQAGLLDRAETYYENSVAWLATFRKQALETVRASAYYRGYDFLGGHDHNQIGGGYEAGFLNEFFELKPGDSIEDLLRFNAPSVLLLDLGRERVFGSGDTLSRALSLSHWGPLPIENGRLEILLQDAEEEVYSKRSFPVTTIESGQLVHLDTLSMDIPDLNKPARLNISVLLRDKNHRIANDWDIWVFPRVQTRAEEQRDSRVSVVKQIQPETLDSLVSGATVVLLGSDVFPKHSLDYTIGLAGRTHGNLATVINSHPILKDFPHTGWCDWQFKTLFSDTATVVFDTQQLVFEPIIEVVSSYKYVIKQAVLFEYKVGRGRLIVSTLNFQDNDPAGAFLLEAILAYAAHPEWYVDAPELKEEQLQKMLIDQGRAVGNQNNEQSQSENQKGNLDAVN